MKEKRLRLIKNSSRERDMLLRIIRLFSYEKDS